MRFFEQVLAPPMAEVVGSLGPALSKRAFHLEDAESEPMPEMLWAEGWAQIKNTIQAWVRELGSPD